MLQLSKVWSLELQLPNPHVDAPERVSVPKMKIPKMVWDPEGGGIGRGAKGIGPPHPEMVGTPRRLVPQMPGGVGTPPHTLLKREASGVLGVGEAPGLNIPQLKCPL